MEKLGSATWKRQRIQKGVEPDACFYVANAGRIIGKREIDLESDPPPDIAVEIDTTNSSRDKLSIYAALRIPEIWRYDGKQAEIFHLKADSYVQTETSMFLVGLSSSLLTELIELSKSQSQTTVLKLFRQQLRSRKDQ